MLIDQELIEKIMMTANSQEIYDSLCNDNPAVVVMKIYDQIKRNKQSKISKESKCEITSEILRLQGNEDFRSKQYGNTLKLYNKALLYAPLNSQAMRVAYRNRSLLLFKCKQYEETIKDIEKCFELGGLDLEIKNRLEKRKEQCHTFLLNGSIQDSILSKENIHLSQPNIFKMDSEHLEIPGVSQLVHISTDSTFPRVLAARDIYPGMIVATETGFVSMTDINFTEVSCHYCQKFTLNLIPCNNCCVALFCDDICRKQCLLEYHEIECNLVSREYGRFMRLILKAIIKIRNKCADWKEFVQMSDNIGKTETKINVYDIFSSNSKLSLIINTRLTDLYGRKFYDALETAIIINHLTELSSFFPKCLKEWQNVVAATAKVMMYLFSQNEVVLKGVSYEICAQSLTSFQTHIGYFSFTGKLRHSCDPNIETVSIGNKIVLIAIHPIKKGDELTRSFVQREDKNQDFLLFRHSVPHYNCHVCAERQNCTNMEFKLHLTDEQKMLLRSSVLTNPNFRMSCNFLFAFYNLRHTQFYYNKIYNRFMYIVGYNQYYETKNKLMDRSFIQP